MTGCLIEAFLLIEKECLSQEKYDNFTYQVKHYINSVLLDYHLTSLFSINLDIYSWLTPESRVEGMGWVIYSNTFIAWIHSIDSPKSANLGLWTSPVSGTYPFSNSPYFEFRRTIFLKESILGVWKRIEFKIEGLVLNPNSAIKWLWDLSFYCSKPYNIILKIEIIIVIAGWPWTQNVKNEY